MEASLQEVIRKIEILFSKLNQQFFNLQLEKPVITVSPDSTKGAYGWCTSWRAWKKDGDTDEDGGYYEINLCAEYLHRDFTEVCETLLHEMIHLYNLQHGVKDTSRNGWYHNKHFKEAAENHGLVCEKDAKYGWAHTKLAPSTKEWLQTLEGFDSFSLYREKVVKVSKKSNSKKYVCPSCGQIVRATKEVNVTCSDCQIPFELEE